VVLVGIWILFFPVLLVSVFSAVNLIINRHSRSDFVFFWCAVGLAYISAAVVYRATKNYLTIPARPKDEHDEVKE
jgi:hypothetical protein